jgi:peroxiredoxin
MKRVILATLFAALSATAGSPLFAAGVGQPAPDFALPDLAGKTQKLSDFKGKLVVLEWVNPDCPFVKKHYNSANMPTLQKEAAAKNVVWLSINSTHPQSDEFKTEAQMKSWLESKSASPQTVLFDKDGKVGHAYAAKTTPHMYIIDRDGKLIYAGGIDDKRSTRVEDVKTAKNFVRVALDEALAGKPVSVSTSQPYGCSIKYSS